MRIPLILNLTPISVRRKYLGGTPLNLYIPRWGTTKTLSLTGLKVEGWLKRLNQKHPRPSCYFGEWKIYAKMRVHRTNHTRIPNTLKL